MIYAGGREMKIVGKEENCATPIERKCTSPNWASRVRCTTTSHGELCFFVPTAGADLLEGKVSLPLIFLLQRNPQMRTAIQTVIADGSYARVSRDSLLASLDESGALALAHERAIEYAEAARASLDGLNGSPHADALRSIPTYIVERDR